MPAQPISSEPWGREMLHAGGSRPVLSDPLAHLMSPTRKATRPPDDFVMNPSHGPAGGFVTISGVNPMAFNPRAFSGPGGAAAWAVLGGLLGIAGVNLGLPGAACGTYYAQICTVEVKCRDVRGIAGVAGHQHCYISVTDCSGKNHCLSAQAEKKLDPADVYGPLVLDPDPIACTGGDAIYTIATEKCLSCDCFIFTANRMSGKFKYAPDPSSTNDAVTGLNSNTFASLVTLACISASEYARIPVPPKAIGWGVSPQPKDAYPGQPFIDPTAPPWMPSGGNAP